MITSVALKTIAKMPFMGPKSIIVVYTDLLGNSLVSRIVIQRWELH